MSTEEGFANEASGPGLARGRRLPESKRRRIKKDVVRVRVTFAQLVNISYASTPPSQTAQYRAQSAPAMTLIPNDDFDAAAFLQQLRDYVLPPHCRRVAGHKSLLVTPMLILLLQSALILHAPRSPAIKIPFVRWLAHNHAQPLRALLVLPLIITSMHMGLAAYFEHPPMPLQDQSELVPNVHIPNMYNFTFACMGCLFICKSIEFATLPQQPRLSFSDPEDSPEKDHDGATPNGDGDATQPRDKRRPPRPFFFPHTWIPLFVDLVLNCSGHGWEWGAGRLSKAGFATVNPPTRRFDRAGRSFLLRRLTTAICLFALFWFLAFVMSQPRALAAFDWPMGSNTFAKEPYASSRLATIFARGVLAILTGGVGICSLNQASVCCWSIFHFLLDARARVYWDVLPFGNIYRTTSIHRVWGKEWHGVMRRAWTYTAYTPTYNFCKRRLGLGAKVASALGLLALFALSGLFHEIGQGAMRQGVSGFAPLLPDNQLSTLRRQKLPDCEPLDPRRKGFGADGFINLRFFVAQAVGLILETCFTTVTGRKVGGVVGWVWTVTWLIYWGSGLYKVSWYDGEAAVVSVANCTLVSP